MTGYEYDKMKEELTPYDFQMTLSYYGIEVRKNKILCPFHNDRHYGSCVITKSKDAAKCYSCGEYFDAIDIVSRKEGLSFRDALIFLWEKILGREPILKNNTRKPVISYKDLRFIGLGKAGGGSVKCYLNIVDYKNEKMPSLCMIDYDRYDPDGYLVYTSKRMDSMEEVLGQKLFMEIAKEKAKETYEFYDTKLKELGDSSTELGALCANDGAFADKMFSVIFARRSAAARILKKIERAA